MIPARPAIKDGEWIITLQLEIDGKPSGDPKVLRFADSYAAAQNKNSTGRAEDVGFLVASALNERALRLKPKRRKK